MGGDRSYLTMGLVPSCLGICSRGRTETGKAPRPRLERGRGSASADDSQSREVGSQNQYTVEQDDAEARHLLGPLLDDLSDGGPSTNRRGYVKET